MARVSKKLLSNTQLEKLFAQLNKSVSKLNTKESEKFLKELLGEEERVMLAKRLAIIIMLSHNYSIYKTAKTLNVSTSTTERIQQKLSSGQYSHILSSLSRSKNHYLDIINSVDSILHLGGILPRYAGTRRFNLHVK